MSSTDEHDTALEERIEEILSKLVDTAEQAGDPTEKRLAGYRKQLTDTHFAKLFTLWDTLFDVECNRPCSKDSMQLFLQAAFGASVSHSGSTFKGSWPRAKGIRVLSLLARILIKGSEHNKRLLIRELDSYACPSMPGQHGVHAIRLMVADKYFSARSKKADAVADESAALQELLDHHHRSEGNTCSTAHSHSRAAYET